MKTRRQKAEQEQAGIPPTPPRELPTTTRTKRAHNTRSNADTEPSTHPPHSTRRAASTRSTRGSKRGRPAKQPPAGAIDIFDASTQADTETHSDTSAHITAKPVVENQERETPASSKPPASPKSPASPKTPIAHPVLGSEVEVFSTPPETSRSATRPPSATSIMFAEALASVAPRHDSPATFPFKERRILQASSPKGSKSLGPDIPDQPALGQTPPPLPPSLGTSPQLELPDHISLQKKSPIISLSPSVAAPASPKSPSIPPPQQDPSQFVFNWPKPSETEKLHVIIHVLVDAKVAGRLSKAGKDPKLAIAIPSDMLPDLLAFIAEHPFAQETELQSLLQVHPVAKDVTTELTEIDSAGFITSNKRKVRDNEDDETTIDTDGQGKTKRLKKAFAETSARKMRNALEETDQQHTARSPSNTPERSAKRTKRVPQMYDDKGVLTLGAFKEVPIDSDDDEATSKQSFIENVRPGTDHSPNLGDEPPNPSSSLAQDFSGGLHGQPWVEQVQETPRARGWGLASFLPSARSVTRFIPGLSHTTAPTAPLPPATTPTRQPPNPAAAESSRNNINTPATPELNIHHPLLSRTEPRPNSGAEGSRVDPVVENATARPAHRHPVSRPKRQLLTRAEAEQKRKDKDERKFVQEQTEFLRKEEARKAEETRQREEAEQHLMEIQKAQQPGTKRKRLPSPDVIPNPPGVSFGMDLQYFGFDSDDEEDDEGPTTPTREPPSKRTRISLPDGNDSRETIKAPLYTGDPYRATPYTGTMFAISSSTTKDNDDESFYDKKTSVDETAVQAKSSKDQTCSPNTPVPGPTMTFKVPSPTDSDVDEDEDEDQIQDKDEDLLLDEYEDEIEDQDDVSADITPTKSVSTPSAMLNPSTTIQTSPLKSKLTQPSPITETPPASKPITPPARPTPQHAALPPSIVSAASDTALARARHHALKHQPMQPSRLRESSRLSTSTVGSEAEEESRTDNEHCGPEVEARYITRTLPAPSPSRTLSPPRQQPSATNLASNAAKVTPIFASYVDYHQMMTGRVKTLIDKNWDIVGDSGAASTQFDEDFAAWKQQLSEAVTEKPEVEESCSTAATETRSATLDNSAQAATGQSTYVSAKVQAFINENWTDGDEDLLEMDFSDQFEAWIAANNGDSAIAASAR